MITDAPRPVLVLFCDDLRVTDNPALTAAMEHHVPVIALFVLDEESDGIRPLGEAAKWWLHHSLEHLRSSLMKLNVPLVFKRGRSPAEVELLVDSVGAQSVFWNRRYGGPEREADTQTKAALIDKGVGAESFPANLLFEPWEIRTKSNTPFSVFTPFWRACTSMPPPRLPFPMPEKAAPDTDLSQVTSLSLEELDLLPTGLNWTEGLGEEWIPGESEAQATLEAFISRDLSGYSSNRDFPSLPATSRLSPRLRWGEISPFQVWHRADKQLKEDSSLSKDTKAFLTELGWREFAWHTLFYSPDMSNRNLKTNFNHFPWDYTEAETLSAWKEGRTGFPLVDAGMKELWRSGWMQGRVRMVAASFLTKNLLIDWRIGERWFWDTLVDADAASNPFNWQWVAGSGADAAPYFRIFNPELQAKKFDPSGEYIRQNLPEWGTDRYPAPMIDLASSRDRALEAYESSKQ